MAWFHWLFCSWEFVDARGAHKYFRCAVCGARCCTTFKGIYGPADRHWLLTGEWSVPMPPKDGAATKPVSKNSEPRASPRGRSVPWNDAAEAERTKPISRERLIEGLQNIVKMHEFGLGREYGSTSHKGYHDGMREAADYLLDRLKVTPVVRDEAALLIEDRCRAMGIMPGMAAGDIAKYVGADAEDGAGETVTDEQWVEAVKKSMRLPIPDSPSPVFEGLVIKGGVNEPNISGARPPVPGGSLAKPKPTLFTLTFATQDDLDRFIAGIMCLSVPTTGSIAEGVSLEEQARLRKSALAWAARQQNKGRS